MKAIVLCGGLGTRLGHLTSEMPKPILEVGGRPFLEYVLDQIACAPVDEIILAVGFHWEKIEKIIGLQWGNIPVSYSIEDRPLGTGGAIRKAMKTAEISEAIVVNGDTLLKINPEFIWNFGRNQNADIALALKFSEEVSRFGVVRVNSENRVEGFEEKEVCSGGLINAGLYYVKNLIFSSIQQETFSFENDVLSSGYKNLKIVGMKTDAYFIDMGIPYDYARAQIELLNQ